MKTTRCAEDAKFRVIVMCEEFKSVTTVREDACSRIKKYTI